MMKYILSLLILFFSIFGNSQIVKKYYASQGYKYGVQITTPTAPGTYDAIIVCHGLGGVGTTGNTDAGLNYITAMEFPAQMMPQAQRFILVSPKLPSGNWQDNNYAIIDYAIELLKKDFKFQRIYIAAHSLGGQVATGYPASSDARRVMISGSVCISGVRISGVDYTKLKNYPIYFIHAPVDDVVPITQSESIWRDAGSKDPFDRIPWGHGYIAVVAGQDKKYWDWLEKQGTIVTPPIDPIPTRTIVARLFVNGMEVIVYSDKTAEVK